MRHKGEKILGVISMAGLLIGLTMLFIIALENFADAEMLEYIAKVILYPSALLFIRFLWKTFMDNKIRSKSEREEDFRREMEEYQEEQ